MSLSNPASVQMVKNIIDGTTPPIKAIQDGNGDNIADTYAKQNGEYPNMTVGGLSYSKFGATSTGEYTDCYVEICNVAFKTNWGNASIILLVNGYMPYTTQRSGIIEIDVRAASNVWTVKLAKVLSGNLEADRLSIYSDENNVIHVYLHVQKEVFAITKLSALYDGVNITYPNTVISTLPDGVILGNNVNIARYDGDGNVIADTYATKSEISTQYIRITDLDSGVYRLTFSGTKFIYTDGSTNSTTTTFPEGLILLIVNKSSIEDNYYWTWKTFLCDSTSTPLLKYGSTTTTSGETHIVNLPSSSGTLALTSGTYSSMSVGSATKATQDSSGNNIINTYATKTELPNPNLLINPNFKINQRGSSSYTSIGYTVDRWYKEVSTGTIYTWTNGIRIYGNSSIIQYIEDDLQLNTAYTVTVRSRYNSTTANLTTTSVTATTPTSKPTSNTVLESVYSNGISLYFGWNSTKAKYYVEIITGSSSVNHYIESAKLEIGSVSTPFIPSDTATEILKCQRYYYKTPSGYGFDIPISKVNTSTTDRRGNVFFPVTMRKSPTISNVTTEQSGITIIKQFINANGFLAGVNGYTGTDQGPVITAYTADAEI